jgi:hypothetical protein
LRALILVGRLPPALSMYKSRLSDGTSSFPNCLAIFFCLSLSSFFH